MEKVIYQKTGEDRYKVIRMINITHFCRLDGADIVVGDRVSREDIQNFHKNGICKVKFEIEL